MSDVVHRSHTSRRRIHVRGVVQGVGFRPFVYALARRHELTGFVGNDSAGVFIEVEGADHALDAFQTALTDEAPPLAHIDDVATTSIPEQGDSSFQIRSSTVDPAARTLISPDLCICDDCLRELFDPADRRYLYPFINCTNCGPRYTIVRDIPYDRPLTTMAAFPMCDACRAEYEDPANRRFHAQPNACPVCGPRVEWVENDRWLMGNGQLSSGTPLNSPDPSAMLRPSIGKRLDHQTGAVVSDDTDTGSSPDFGSRDSRRDEGFASDDADTGSSPDFGGRDSRRDEGFASDDTDTGSSPDSGGGWEGVNAALAAARQVLASGGIIAVKGLGGFHLACDAANDDAVRLLRTRKGRGDKPFAVMAPDLAAVEQIAYLDEHERVLLAGRERPIVLLRKRAGSPLSGLIAPGNGYVGVMLPYTPLHYLLMTNACPERSRRDELRMTNGVPNTYSSFVIRRSPFLIMTSGNYADEPIVSDNAVALERLAGLADGFLLHDREIHVPCDDAVVRVVGERELPIRRSRGYAPFPVRLPFAVPPLLATGGELKATFCLADDNQAFMSQHIGDMENLETLQSFDRAVEHMQSIFRVQPQAVVCDRHPGYLSTRWAQEHAGARPLLQVQHHHAHIAAVMAEHGLDGRTPVIGFAFDGTGYGDDGAIWGGEVLVADYANYDRTAHLRYVPLPGGDASIKRPYRTALAYLHAAGLPWARAFAPVAACPTTERSVLQRQMERGFNTVPCSSMGRLFDAVAALCGIREVVDYEGQAAIEFEALATASDDAYAFGVEETVDHADTIEIDHAGVIRAIVADLGRGMAVGDIAGKFHNAVADLIVTLSRSVGRRHGLDTVALSGGVFQNVTLLEAAVARLDAAGFHVLHHHLVPPNDGGLALGQAAIGGRRLAQRTNTDRR